MIAPKTVATIRMKYEALNTDFNERTRRHWAASEAMVLGYGGITAVHKATGIAISTIRIGLRELQTTATPSDIKQEVKHVRKNGGGRKKLTEHDSEIIPVLNSLIEPFTRGDPMSPLRWTCKSTRTLAKKLCNQKHKISHSKVCDLLHGMGYTLQANKKTRGDSNHPDRNAQFEYINNSVKKEQVAGEPVVSVDTKKKELIGDFKNPGREWRPKGQPEKVRIHDFPLKGLGKVTPHGIYDLKLDRGWVTVGIDHDTAEFAVESISKWWQKSGCRAYPNARKLTITADCGGSNGYKNKLWKYKLQKFANKTGLTIHVHHFPPGTSKWNKIEHRLFSFISQNWRGRPLLNHAVIVNMIASTRTNTGMKVDCVLDAKKYPTGKKVSGEDFKKINIKYDKFHGEWNYAISPQKKKQIDELFSYTPLVYQSLAGF